MTDYLIDPFVEFAFMRRALAAALILALGGAPLGVFMSLRRMTLVGDALAHAILPGIAVAFLIAGLSIWAMTLGGLIAALAVAFLAAILTRFTRLKEDAAFSMIYLLALAVGVTLLSLRGSSTNLMHLLFGNVLGIDQDSLMLITGATCVSLFVLAALYRRLVVEGFDPDFLRVTAAGSPLTGWTQPLFFVLLMLNLVAAFQALGSLMALGLMILPAIAARFWSRTVDTMIPAAIAFAAVSSYAGLLGSFYARIPSGPAIVMVAGSIALLSALIGRYGSVVTYLKEGDQ